jgi:competence protein ComEC
VSEAGTLGFEPIDFARRSSPRARSRFGLGTLGEVLELERDRWFLWVPVLFAGGIGIYFQLPAEPHWTLPLAGLLAAIALRLLLRRGVLAAVTTAVLLSFALGLVAAKARTEALRAPVIARPTAVVEITGHVERIEPRLPKGYRLTLRVIAIAGVPADATPFRIRLKALIDEPPPALGASVSVKGAVSPPPGPNRPGGYDFARLAWFERLGGSGYIVAAPTEVVPAVAPSWDFRIAVAVERLRQWVGQRIRAVLAGDRGALADAIVTGERGSIPEVTMDALRDSGLAHILAISGFNMAIMAGALFGTTRAALALVPVLALRLPLKKIAAAMGALGAGFCLLISGAESPAARAFVMIALMLLAIVLDRPAVSMRNLALAALVLLALAPENVLDVGFQMSFAAVVALMAVYEWFAEHRASRPQSGGPRGVLRRSGHYLLGTLASTMIASLAIAPIATYHFHKLSQLGLIANIVAVPLFAFVIMPVVMLVLLPFGLEAMPLLGIDYGLTQMMAVATGVAGLSGAATRVPQLPLTAVVAMLLGGLWLCLWRRRWRFLGLLGIAVGLALSGGGRPVDILVGEGGKPVAIRLDDGRLSALPSHGDEFDLREWLQSDGDGRKVREAARGKGFTCDAAGCIGRVGAAIIAIADSPAALRDDCETADILVLRFNARVPCRKPRIVLPLAELRSAGTHALTVGPDGAVTVATVAASRGRRPWTSAAAPAAGGER